MGKKIAMRDWLFYLPGKKGEAKLVKRSRAQWIMHAACNIEDIFGRHLEYTQGEASWVTMHRMLTDGVKRSMNQHPPLCNVIWEERFCTVLNGGTT